MGLISYANEEDIPTSAPLEKVFQNDPEQIDPATPEAPDPERANDCLSLVLRLEKAEYQAVERATAVGRRLAEGIKNLRAAVNLTEWMDIQAAYRDYLDAQTILLEKSRSPQIPIENIRDFMIIIIRYLKSTHAHKGTPDLRYREVVADLLLKFEHCLWNNEDDTKTSLCDDIFTSIGIYRRLVDELAPKSCRVEVDETEQKTDRVPEDIPIDDQEPGDFWDDPELIDTDEPDLDLSRLHLVQQKRKPIDDLSETWVDAGDLSVKEGFQIVTSPFFTNADGPEFILDGLRQCKAALDTDFPHFKAVTEYFYGQLLMAAESAQTIQRFAPVLLLGEPGIGKTTYVRQLAELLEIPFAMLSLANISGGFVLTGADSTWRGSKPGWLARTFLELQVANPIFMLDEIDKASSSDGRANVNNNVQETLLSLLEPQTSSRFVDEYLAHLEIDLSYASFIATANDVTNLSDPLLSRFQLMEVPSPSLADRQKMVQRIYENQLKEAGLEHRFAPTLTQDMLDVLVNTTSGKGNLRDLHGTLRSTMGNAMIRARESSAGSSAYSPDAPVTLRPMDMKDHRSRSGYSVGFL